MGLTDQFVRNKISAKDYDDYYYELQREVLRLNPQADQNYMDKIEDRAYEATQNEGINCYKVTTTRLAVNSISTTKDLNLFMLRCWNLYDSMKHSNNVITKLKIWHDDGDKKINKLIAKLGMPMEEAKQKFQFMSPKYKEGLKEKMIKVCSHEDLDILVSSFLKQVDNNTQFSAMDMVHCINAILENPKSVSDIVCENSKKAKLVAGVLDKDGVEVNSGAIFEERALNFEDNFWCVYHNILTDQSSYLKKAVGITIDYQESIVKEIFHILEKKAIKSCTSFRYAILNSDFFQDNKFNKNVLS